ncbi:hypothetical protein ABZ917_17500 [Nonomuraea wenchangensis]
MPEPFEHFVFLVITWGDSPPRWDGTDERDLFGPFLVREDGSHLDEATKTMRAWERDHPDLPGVMATLFLTRLDDDRP